MEEHRALRRGQPPPGRETAFASTYQEPRSNLAYLELLGSSQHSGFADVATGALRQWMRRWVLLTNDCLRVFSNNPQVAVDAAVEEELSLDDIGSFVEGLRAAAMMRRDSDAPTVDLSVGSDTSITVRKRDGNLLLLRFADAEIRQSWYFQLHLAAVRYMVSLARRAHDECDASIGGAGATAGAGVGGGARLDHSEQLSAAGDLHVAAAPLPGPRIAASRPAPVPPSAVGLAGQRGIGESIHFGRVGGSAMPFGSVPAAGGLAGPLRGPGVGLGAPGLGPSAPRMGKAATYDNASRLSRPEFVEEAASPRDRVGSAQNHGGMFQLPDDDEDGEDDSDGEGLAAESWDHGDQLASPESGPATAEHRSPAGPVGMAAIAAAGGANEAVAAPVAVVEVDAAPALEPPGEGGGAETFGVWCHMGGRRYMEDRHVTCPSVAQLLLDEGHSLEVHPAGGSLREVGVFAVFDGHGGWGCAQHASTRLPLMLARHEALVTDTCRALGDCIVDFEREWHALFEDPAATLSRVGYPKNQLFAGATALIAVLGPAGTAEPRWMTLAHLGDCRAVMCHADGGFRELTEDQTPESDRERIVAAGGWVTTEKEVHLPRVSHEDGMDKFVRRCLDRRAEAATEEAAAGGSPRQNLGRSTIYTTRVCGELAVARSLGDRDLKVVSGFDYPLPFPEGKTAADFTADLVSSQPALERIQLTPNDRFLIIACDGLWEALTSEDAAEIVRVVLEQDGGTAEDASRRLVTAAVRLGSTDNITALVVDLRST